MVVGENGTILRTTDGGTNWLPLPGITTHNLKEVQFSGATGYILGENNTLLKSTDYGASWQPLAISTNDTIMALYVYSADTVYVAGTNGLIMKTADGGNNWTVIPGPAVDQDLIDIEVPAPGYIYVIPEPYSSPQNENLYRTRDEGLSWFRFTFQSTFNFYDIISCADTSTIYTIGKEYYNLGKLFINDTLINEIGYNGEYLVKGEDIFVSSVGKIWVPGWDNIICSDNRGSYITTFEIDSLNNFNVIGFYNVNDPIYNAIDFAEDTIGYVVGWNGLIRKNPTGEHWIGVQKTKQNAFRITPNPAGETIRIDFKFPMKNTRLEIYNTTGELIQEQAIRDHETVNIAELPAGAYIVQIKSERYVSSQKLIKK